MRRMYSTIGMLKNLQLVGLEAAAYLVETQFTSVEQL